MKIYYSNGRIIHDCDYSSGCYYTYSGNCIDCLYNFKISPSILNIIFDYTITPENYLIPGRFHYQTAPLIDVTDLIKELEK